MIRSVAALVCLLGWTACGASVDGNANGGDDDDTPPIDAADDNTIDAANDIDGAAAACGKRVVFLSFEGETLTRATPSDSHNNLAQWMNIANGAAPRYRSNDANRDTEIQAIVDGVTAQLASFPITVVTTRPPATQDYMMVIYGGVQTDVGSRFSAAVQQLDCNDTLTHNDVAWIADGVTGTQRIVNDTVGAIGFGLGLTATTDPQDCMCSWANGCQPDNATPCRLTEGIARDPAANQTCPNVSTQDETTAFRQAFCQ